jgi:phospholipase/lecithinase/hemolysin
MLGGLQGIHIAPLDMFALLHAIAGLPGAFGLTHVTSACLTPNVPPFTCRTPDEYLFWDGMHPTRAAHRIIAQAALEALVP